MTVDEEYEMFIPPDCVFQTIEEHAEMLFCYKHFWFPEQTCKGCDLAKR